MEAPIRRSASRVIWVKLLLNNRRRVDVGEHVLFHRVGINCRNHDAVFDADHHRGIAHHEQRLFGPFSSGFIGHLIHAVQVVGTQGDVARLEALRRVRGDFERLTGWRNLLA